MRVAAKWFIIAWTLICLAGGAATCVFPFFTAAEQQSGRAMTEEEKTGQGLAIAGCSTCGSAAWFMVWVAGAAVGVVFFFIGKPTDKIVQEDYARPPVTTAPNLCRHCGKYYQGSPRFCPNCGEPTSGDTPTV